MCPAMYIHIRDANESSCISQVANPDISGIGVRLSFYIQNFLLGGFLHFSWLWNH